LVPLQVQREAEVEAIQERQMGLAAPVRPARYVIPMLPFSLGMPR